ALSLFGHCVMDGLQCWDIGTRYSEELADYSDWTANEPAVKRSIGGSDEAVYYYLKYFGLYNYHVLGMWQASANKDIIDAATTWEMPEVWTSTGNAWRVGDERYPSYVNFHHEPLARVKLSADGQTLLAIACNPYNTGVQQVRLRRPGDAREVALTLVGDYPAVRRFALAP
ncbi:MAG: hypothetical protein HZB16_06275, partial [Armatimonadetes bacterium]|nr:hypothetical protein [Armatimonadota bacterium]